LFGLAIGCLSFSVLKLGRSKLYVDGWHDYVNIVSIFDSWLLAVTVTKSTALTTYDA